MKTTISMLALAAALAACGGAGESDVASGGGSGTRLLAATATSTTTVVKGVSIVSFPGNIERYIIAASGTGYTITDKEGSGSVTSVTASQRLQFADTSVAFDLSGIPGQAYRLYQAAFNRTPDLAGLGFWMSVMDDGASAVAVAGGFMESKEFQSLYGSNPTNSAMVTAYYANVLHRAPDQAGFDFWVDVLNRFPNARADVLSSFSESPENKTGTAAAVANGIQFVPVSRVAGNTVPGMPSIASVSAGDGAATVVFSSPSSNGGSSITSYTATCSGANVSKSASGSASPITVTGLSNGVLATCTVKATNALGSGAASAGSTVTPVASAVVATVPGAPSLSSATAGNASASLAFSAPSSDGGAAISSYAASCKAGSSTMTGAAASSPVSVTGLTNGTSYSCTVAAINAVGAGSASNALTVTPVAPVVVTVPGAPTIGAATAGNASASIAFTAPASTGGAPISAYTATCIAGSTTKTGTATASPITVSSLSNSTAYSCTVVATNSAGNSSASGAVSVTPTSSAGTITGHLYCPYSASVVNPTYTSLTSTVAFTCTTTSRSITGTGVPDHAVGAFPNSGNPNAIKAITVSFTNTLNPAVVSSTGTAVDHILGYANNGVKYDPSTAESYQNAGVWKIEALNQTYFPFGVDTSNAHVQPDGAYHYHGMPEGLISKIGKGQAMTLVGFAVDGFPIYARYGYTTATSATSAIRVMTPSYRLKTSASSGRPSTTSIPMGTFTQDYEYVAGLGDLDECNGRTGVTPEFPNGIYHYYITDGYPYIQRCVKGTAASTTGGSR